MFVLQFLVFPSNIRHSNYTTGYLCIQGLLLNEKESLIPNDCHCGEQIVLTTIQIYWFRPETNVLLMLIDNHFARNGYLTKYYYESYINTHYRSLLIKFV